ncbi:MAG: signal recognition particle protein [Muribaculaceae bacterium]|nr:signal recognition particle protein [Muribaculaceae bacterium]
MFNSLQDKLETAFKKLKGQGKITEINVSETLKDVRRALVEADVSYKVANTFMKTVKDKAMGQNVLNAVKPQELMLKIVYDELADLMGREPAPLVLKNKPAVILMSGLQGSGKTTFSGKLARRLKSKGMRPLLVACDVYRPAAIEQLKVVGNSVEVPVYSEEGNMDPVQIALDGIAHAKEEHRDVVIVDTAGRLAVDEKMMDEIAAIRQAIRPDETLFVVDAMTGQDAVNTAREFNDRIDFDGVILTKLDGDTRGGAALTIREVVHKPIKFVGVGEKMQDIQDFDPEGMASRILGMGDLGELAKRIQEIYDVKEAEAIEKKLRTNKFDFEDFLKQIQNIKKMGNIKDLASMLPGVGKALKDVDIDNSAFKSIEAIIYSMTPYERKHPDEINGMRRQRIAKGSGTSLQEVNRLMKQFADTRKVMKAVTSGGKNPQKMMQQMRQAKAMMKQGGRR